MPRPHRLEFAGGWHHIICRSARKRALYIDDGDRQHFLDLVASSSERWKLEIHAYCLMSNHYHLMVHTPDGHLPRAMHLINSGYTRRFNATHHSEGALFKERYKSILIERESYCLQLVRYIHLNPVKAGLSSEPSMYRWSSHRAYLDDTRRPLWLNVADVLSHFGDDATKARRAFEEFVRAGIPEHISKLMNIDRLPRALGSQSFMRRYLF